MYAQDCFRVECEALFDDAFEEIVHARELAEYRASGSVGSFHEHETITGRTYTRYLPSLRSHVTEQDLATDELFSLHKYVGIVKIGVQNITDTAQAFVMSDFQQRLISASGKSSKGIGYDKRAVVQLQPGQSLEITRLVDRKLYLAEKP